MSTNGFVISWSKSGLDLKNTTYFLSYKNIIKATPIKGFHLWGALLTAKKLIDDQKKTKNVRMLVWKKNKLNSFSWIERK